MSARKKLKAPFPYFGGKATIARAVWLRLGDVSNYIEPFCGSAAMLLSRPHTPRIETVNDYDCHIANVWRALQSDPDSVAEWCDRPVNEADLHAIHRWLVYGPESPEFRNRVRTDPDYFDAKFAGYWLFGICCWIGSGWCDAGAEWNQIPGVGGTLTGVNGVAENMPQLRGDSGAAGGGVHSSAGGKRPRIHGGAGADPPGVHSGMTSLVGRPQLADAYDIGRGVHATPKAIGQIPDLSSGRDTSLGKGIHGTGPSWIGCCAERRAWLLDWFGRLRDRLRNVRVCCGDWERVCGSPSTTTRLGLTGIFLDPPYAKNTERMLSWARHLRGDGDAPEAAKATNRAGDLYATDDHDVDHLVARVLNYCREHGTDSQMRIALCGYDGEHNGLEEIGWQPLAWRTNGGYSNRRGGAANTNAGRERVWFSPACLPEIPEDSLVGQKGLFQ